MKFPDRLVFQRVYFFFKSSFRRTSVQYYFTPFSFSLDEKYHCSSNLLAVLSSYLFFFSLEKFRYRIKYFSYDGLGSWIPTVDHVLNVHYKYYSAIYIEPPGEQYISICCVSIWYKTIKAIHGIYIINIYYIQYIEDVWYITDYTMINFDIRLTHSNKNMWNTVWSNPPKTKCGL